MDFWGLQILNCLIIFILRSGYDLKFGILVNDLGGINIDAGCVSDNSVNLSNGYISLRLGVFSWDQLSDY